MMLSKAYHSRTLGKADGNVEALGSERPGLLGPSGREHGDGWKNIDAAPLAQSSAPFKTCCAKLEAKNKPRRCLLPGGAPALNQQPLSWLGKEKDGSQARRREGCKEDTRNKRGDGGWIHFF